jgi:hypothetical protein
MKIDIRFESDHDNPHKDRNYVGVLADSALTSGLIASQNAGSTLHGIYYKVGGGGANGLFEAALGSLVTAVNRSLATAYDERYGNGAWDADAKQARTDRLTSFYIPIPRPRPADATVGERVAGMLYSVGPQLQGKIVDRDAYRSLYLDALDKVAAVNRGATERIAALRITMLSTGIFGGTSDPAEMTALARDAAALILDALEAAMKGPHAADLPGTILVNAPENKASKERDAFSNAAAARSLATTAEGFSLTV